MDENTRGNKETVKNTHSFHSFVVFDSFFVSTCIFNPFFDLDFFTNKQNLKDKIILGTFLGILLHKISND